MLAAPDLIDREAYEARLTALPQAELQRLTDYFMAAIFATPGKYDHRLIPVILDQFLANGHAVLPSNLLARGLGTTRATICQSRKRLEKAGFIRQLGVTSDRRYVCVPQLERADEYRARCAAIDLQFNDELGAVDAA